MLNEIRENARKGDVGSSTLEALVVNRSRLSGGESAVRSWDILTGITRADNYIQLSFLVGRRVQSELIKRMLQNSNYFVVFVELQKNVDNHFASLSSSECNTICSIFSVYVIQSFERVRLFLSNGREKL